MHSCWCFRPKATRHWLGGVTISVVGADTDQIVQSLTAGEIGACALQGLPTPGDYAVTFSLEFGGNLLRSFLTPLFGPNLGGVAPIERESLTSRLTATYNVGDEAAKREALEMLAAGNGEPSPQVALLADEFAPPYAAAAARGAELAADVAERDSTSSTSTEEPTTKESVGA